jgi:hypothetical protein
LISAGVLLFGSTFVIALIFASRGGVSAPGGSVRSGRYKVGEEMRFGDLGVTVVRGKAEGFISTNSGDFDFHSGDTYVVTIGLKNYNPNRVLEVPSQAEVATLSDDVGNTYAPIRARSDTGRRAEILGQITPGHKVRLRSDDKNEMDLLVFDKPVPGATVLTLTLDADRYGGKGTIAVTIPVREIVRLQIAANQPWQDTGIELGQGMKLTISARGTWSKGAASTSIGGFNDANDPTQATLRQLGQEAETIRLQTLSLSQQLPAGNYIPRPSMPRRMPKESQNEYQERVALKEKEHAEKQKSRDELFQRLDEIRAKLREANLRVGAERRRLADQRVIPKLPLMCLIARFGENGQPLAPSPKFEYAFRERLYFRANDLELKENNGSIEVEIEILR